MRKKVMISAGGTGGHIYPAVALARQLEKKHPEIELLFVGGKLGSNRFFKGHPYAYREVSCGPMSSKNPLTFVRNFAHILRGIWQSRRIIKTYRPDLVVGFGSYHTFPTLFAAKLTRVPVILHEANSIPGKVIRLLARHVDVTGVHFPETMSLLPGASVEVGMPLREEYHTAAASREEALSYFGLDLNKLTLLIFGGSQGAKAINSLVMKSVKEQLYSYSPSLQILHFTGSSQQTEEARNLYRSCDIKCCVKDFEPRMALAWKASDLMISRAGAATIAEQMEFEVPGILIPYPFAADQHQDKNAEFMVTKVGGALKFSESDLDYKKLSHAIVRMISEDQALLRAMRQAMHLYKQRKQRTDLCSLVCEVLESEVRT